MSIYLKVHQSGEDEAGLYHEVEFENDKRLRIRSDASVQFIDLGNEGEGFREAGAPPSRSPALKSSYSHKKVHAMFSGDIEDVTFNPFYSFNDNSSHYHALSGGGGIIIFLFFFQ